ncbi:MAG TPA: hypothetical protein DCG75_17730 [Bacteroidales bacterium]|nr:hypothetical protein [Bacteroidales bacterium]
MKKYISEDDLYNSITLKFKVINWSLYFLLIILIFLIIVYILPVWESDKVKQYIRDGFNMLGLFTLLFNILLFFFNINKSQRSCFETNPFKIDIEARQNGMNIELKYKVNSIFYKKTIIIENHGSKNEELNIYNSEYLVKTYSLPIILTHSFNVIFVFEGLLFGKKAVSKSIQIPTELSNNNQFLINGQQHHIVQS